MKKTTLPVIAKFIVCKNRKGEVLRLSTSYISHTGGFLVPEDEVKAKEEKAATVKARELYRRICEVADAEARNQGVLVRGQCSVNTRAGTARLVSTVVTAEKLDQSGAFAQLAAVRAAKAKHHKAALEAAKEAEEAKAKEASLKAGADSKLAHDLADAVKSHAPAVQARPTA